MDADDFDPLAEKTKTEPELTRKLCKALEKAGAMCLALVSGGRMAEAGWPDRYVSSTSWSGWLEFKSARGRLREDQRRVITELRRRGTPCFVARFATEAHLVIEDVDRNSVYTITLDWGSPELGKLVLRSLAEAQAEDRRFDVK